MTESIGKKLTQVISPIVNVNLSEAETQTYPFAVYDYYPIPVRSKDGVVKYKAEVELSIVSKSFDEAKTLYNRIATAIETNMRTSAISATITGWTPSCNEGLWSIDTTIIVNQYA